MARNWGLVHHLPLWDGPREALLFPEASSLCHVFGVGSWLVFVCPGLPVLPLTHFFLRVITLAHKHTGSEDDLQKPALPAYHVGSARLGGKPLNHLAGSLSRAS